MVGTNKDTCLRTDGSDTCVLHEQENIEFNKNVGDG